MKPEELRIGDNLEVISTGNVPAFWKITGIDPIYYKDAHSAIAAGATETYAEISNLDPPDNQFYYIGRIETMANVRIQIKQPASINRLGTNKSPEGGFLNDLVVTIGDSDRGVDLWISKNYPPNMQLVNNTNVSITPILWWIGRRFSVISIAKPQIYSTVRIGGIS